MHADRPHSESQIDLIWVRDIATHKLQSLSRTETSVRECYLIKQGHFVGVRYESGPFRFQWMMDESHASIMRGGLLIESVNLSGDGFEQRRAA